jgi:hypothetical protein
MSPPLKFTHPMAANASITSEQSTAPIDENERPGSAEISLLKQLEATTELPVRRLRVAKELTLQQFRKPKLPRRMLLAALHFPVQRALFSRCAPFMTAHLS